MMQRVWAGLVALALAGCAAAPQPVVGPVAQPGSLPPQLSNERAEVPSRRAVRNFLEVVEAVEPVAEQECRLRAPRQNCDFQLVVDERLDVPPNAFQTLDRDGRPIIGFTVSLIAQVDNKDQLAFIMAHEAAHHIEGHLALQQRNATIGAVVLGQLAGGLVGSDVAAAQEIGAALGARSYSKDFELEADALGTVITAKAGFNPLRGASFFDRIPDPGNRLLGTHPPNADRIAVVSQTAAQLGFQ